MSDKKEKVYIIMPCGKKFEDSSEVGLKLIEHFVRCPRCKIIGYQNDYLFKKCPRRTSLKRANLSYLAQNKL